MVPQYRPDSVLMLGYAEGTTAGLIRLLYRDVNITGVDIEPCAPSYGVTPIQADAQEFVKTCGRFDTVIVDMFPKDSFEICDFISGQEFADNLIRIADYIIINTLRNPDLSAYSKLRHIGVNKPSGNANLIHYYEVNKIPDLHLFK